MLRISDLMTPQPWTVQLDDSISVARTMLAERQIHHLPVLDADTVVGMVTDAGLAAAGDRVATVADFLVPVDRVAADTPPEDVLDAMTAHHVDAVVVTQRGSVAGIFTSSDAVRVLRDILAAQHGSD